MPRNGTSRLEGTKNGGGSVPKPDPLIVTETWGNAVPPSEMLLMLGIVVSEKPASQLWLAFDQYCGTLVDRNVLGDSDAPGGVAGTQLEDAGELSHRSAISPIPPLVMTPMPGLGSDAASTISCIRLLV